MFRRITYGLLRISLGWVFLWAFIDKLFGLGFTTAPEKAWLAGGSPTFGFLKFAAKGPMAEFYQALAGNVVVDWLFMMGLLGIGVALMLGILIRVAVVFGIAMMLLMYTAVLPPEHNPVVDEHVIYALLLITFLYLPIGSKLGFGNKWSRLSLVQKNPWLK